MVSNPKYEYEIAALDSSHFFNVTLKGNTCQGDLACEDSSVVCLENGPTLNIAARDGRFAFLVTEKPS